MKNWLKSHKGKVIGALVGAFSTAILVGALHLPPTVAAPLADALAKAAENIATDPVQ